MTSSEHSNPNSSEQSADPRFAEMYQRAQRNPKAVHLAFLDIDADAMLDKNSERKETAIATINRFRAAFQLLLNTNAEYEIRSDYRAMFQRLLSHSRIENLDEMRLAPIPEEHFAVVHEMAEKILSLAEQDPISMQ